MSKNNYNTISQFYKSDKTLNHNPPFGITPFYTLGPKPYSLCPEQTGSFQIPPYKLHQKSYDQKFNKHLLFTNLVKDILFINLTHRTDRYQNIHSQFQNLPFDLNVLMLLITQHSLLSDAHNLILMHYYTQKTIIYQML